MLLLSLAAAESAVELADHLPSAAPQRPGMAKGHAASPMSFKPTYAPRYQHPEPHLV